MNKCMIIIIISFTWADTWLCNVSVASVFSNIQNVFFPPLDTTWLVWLCLSDDLKTDRAWIATTITQSINYIQVSLSSAYNIWAQGNVQNQYASLLLLASPLTFHWMFFLSAEMNHKMLAVLCSVRPGWGVCRRLGWRHPLCAERQRWMRPGFGMRCCGWVIGHSERPRVKILRWEWDAFSYA